MEPRHLSGGVAPFTTTPIHEKIMRYVFVTAFIAVLFCVQGAAAQSVGIQLHDIGYEACTQAMQGQLRDVDGAHYRQIVDASSMNRVEFCNCVAEDFSTGSKQDLTLLKSSKRADHLAMMSVMAMTGCLPDSYADPDVIDGDLVDAEPDGDLDMAQDDFAYDESDVNMCQMAFDGELLLPGFDADDVKRKIKSNGQKLDDVCVCSARYFTAGGEALQKEIEEANNPNVVYSSTLAGAISTCVN